MKPRLFAFLSGLCLFLPVARALTLPTSSEIAQAFAALDTNRNNSISRAEWEKASFTLFRAADTNNDNVLVLSELAGSTLTEDTFMLADENRDGRLSIAEFMQLRRAIFQAADIDRDDTLNPVEFELYTLLAQTGWTDRNHDGYIQPSELKAAIGQAFVQLDTNHDGFLSAAETAFMRPAQFTLSDEDHDGRLSPVEFRAGLLESPRGLKAGRRVSQNDLSGKSPVHVIRD